MNCISVTLLCASYPSNASVEVFVPFWRPNSQTFLNIPDLDAPTDYQVFWENRDIICFLRCSWAP